MQLQHYMKPDQAATRQTFARFVRATAREGLGRETE